MPVAVLEVERFTPTCVGTAGDLGDVVPDGPVHPHVRGDGAGARELRRARARFTPTCVGTANSQVAFIWWASVHPHVRGDGVDIRQDADTLIGSPPRAWGRPRVST